MRQVFADQALALDRIFTRTAVESVSNGARLCRDMRLALEAQALSLESYKILLALRDERDGEKISESSERTNGNGNLTV
jgi:hypothetical protein